MPSKEDFIEYFRANPDPQDRLAKRAYSDWLEGEDTGPHSQQHSQLIRSMCHLEDINEKLEALQKQIEALEAARDNAYNDAQALIQEHGPSLFPWRAPREPYDTQSGFIHQFSGDQQQVREFLQSDHFKQHPINDINVSHCSDPSLFALPQFTQLQELGFDTCNTGLREYYHNAYLFPNHEETARAIGDINLDALKYLRTATPHHSQMETFTSDLRIILGSQPFPQLEAIYIFNDHYNLPLLSYITERMQEAILHNKPLPFPKLTNIGYVDLSKLPNSPELQAAFDLFNDARQKAHDLHLDDPKCYKRPEPVEEQPSETKPKTRRKPNPRAGRKDSTRINPTRGTSDLRGAED